MLMLPKNKTGVFSWELLLSWKTKSRVIVSFTGVPGIYQFSSHVLIICSGIVTPSRGVVLSVVVFTNSHVVFVCVAVAVLSPMSTDDNVLCVWVSVLLPTGNATHN